MKRRQQRRGQQRQQRADPLETMRKAMRLMEARAAMEQAKGDSADLKIMCESMMAAAGLASQISAVEDRRGVTPEQLPVSIPVEIIEGTFDLCPKCGWTAPAAPKLEPPPPTEDAPSVPPPAAASNVVELPRRGGSGSGSNGYTP